MTSETDRQLPEGNSGFFTGRQHTAPARATGAPGPHGFSLIEVTIALGVAAFALIAILGLLQTGLTSQKATTEQTAATSIATMIYSDLTAAAGTNTTPQLKIDLSSTPPSPQTIYFSEGGKPTGAIGSAAVAASRYRASVDIKPVATNSKAPTGVRILVTWPAAADPAPAQWPAKQAGSLDIWTTLDRN